MIANPTSAICEVLVTFRAMDISNVEDDLCISYEVYSKVSFRGRGAAEIQRRRRRDVGEG